MRRDVCGPEVQKSYLLPLSRRKCTLKVPLGILTSPSIGAGTNLCDTDPHTTGENEDSRPSSTNLSPCRLTGTIHDIERNDQIGFGVASIPSSHLPPPDSIAVLGVRLWIQKWFTRNKTALVSSVLFPFLVAALTESEGGGSFGKVFKGHASLPRGS